MNKFDGIKHTEIILDALKKEGAEKAVAGVTKKIKSEMNIDSGNLSLYRTTENISVSMTSLIDGKKGFIAGNDLNHNSIAENAAKAVSLSHSSKKDEANDISPEQPFEELSIGSNEPDSEKMYDRLKEFLDYTKSAYPSLQLNQCVLDFTHAAKNYANSNNVRFTENTGVYSFSAMFFAKDSKGTSSFNYSGASHLNLDTPLKDWGGLDEIMRQTCEQTVTKPLTGSFTGDIIITPPNAAEFASLITRLFMGDMSLITETSIWKDKLNEKVCSPLFTLHSYPCKPQAEIPELYTGDGFRLQNTTLIDKGILKEFVLGLYGANKTGGKRCVSGGSSLVIEKGDALKDSMIKGVKRGILLGRFSGGNPAANGGFSGVAKNSYLIEDGKIVQPLSETMIAGNLVKLLTDIIAVSKEEINYGSSSAPWIWSTGVTISGK